MEAGVDRPIELTIKLNGKEARQLKALAQNPHPNYQDNRELMNFAREIFNLVSDALNDEPDDLPF